MKQLALTVAIALSITLGAFWQKQVTEYPHEQAKAACDSAYVELNRASEQRCADLLTQYNFDYICSDYGCYVEVL